MRAPSVTAVITCGGVWSLRRYGQARCQNDVGRSGSVLSLNCSPFVTDGHARRSGRRSRGTVLVLFGRGQGRCRAIQTRQTNSGVSSNGQRLC